MRFLSTDMKDRNMLFAAIPSICASSPKKISIYNEEMIVARCFIGFLIFSRKSLGKTFKETLDGRIKSIFRKNCSNSPILTKAFLRNPMNNNDYLGPACEFSAP